MTSKLLRTLLALALLLALPVTARAATVTIVNIDGPGEGFNDPTPVAPLPGNPGTTLGQQRLNAFQYAAGLWAATLDSAVPIVVRASMDPLSCTPTQAVLGQASSVQVAANFPGAPLANTWYHIALANKIAGFDLIPGAPGTSADDIRAFFNSDIDSNPNCLTGSVWYYGTDHNEGVDQDFVAVVAHELDHGLGFSNFIDESTGSFLGPPFRPDIYSVFTYDNDLGLTWDVMTNAQRVASAINCRDVVWNGPNVSNFAPFMLDLGTPILRVNSPAGIAGDYDVGTANFGPALASPGVTGALELVNDGAGVSVTDACEPLVGFTSGRVALVDRGNCAFTIKVANAEAAGATAVVVADNVAGCPPDGMSGATTPGISSVRISLADGNTIKAQLAGGVNVTVGVDDTRLAGADSAGRPLLYTPDPLEPGSSVSHWDTSATPNLTMEPFISDDLTDSFDLSVMQAADIGWMLLSTCGNNVREGLEQCDGTDLLGQTCLDFGFDGGTLACDGSCNFDTSACVTCNGGRADWSWNLPDLYNLGAFFGYFYDGTTGNAIYKTWGSLVETAPGQGILIGVVYDGSPPNPFYLNGTWQITVPPNQGTFSAQIFEYGTGTLVGTFTGRFQDNPLFSSVGSFGGQWQICQ